ncbi:MAG: hypothetical protein JRN20_05680 [Nitrososphaerota archaeon]|nr:hypothetical protein [Nitrososphaerota archaeon]MDG6922802.1 hypothetical protein [Nitrososphaerota archaeon]
MREVELKKKKALYRFTKTVLMIAGAFLLIYGCWFIISQLITVPRNPVFWFGIFPGYVGGMMILISIAMKLEWFTNARRFW